MDLLFSWGLGGGWHFYILLLLFQVYFFFFQILAVIFLIKKKINIAAMYSGQYKERQQGDGYFVIGKPEKITPLSKQSF